MCCTKRLLSSVCRCVVGGVLNEISRAKVVMSQDSSSVQREAVCSQVVETRKNVIRGGVLFKCFDVFSVFFLFTVVFHCL